MVYIAYKFTQTPDKHKLKKDLSYLSDLVTSKGQQTFVLFRDIRKWGLVTPNRFKHAPVMVKKIWQARKLLVFIDNDHPSFGLDFELLVAKLFRRPITIVAKDTVKLPTIANTHNHLIRFKNLSEISSLPL